MDILQLVLVIGGLISLMVLVYVAFAGKSPGKEANRRLQSLRYRHSDSTIDKVESQFKKAIAARKPKRHKVAGSGSRSEALALRLQRTGKSWTVTQYLYTSLGIGLTLMAVLYLRTGSAPLSLAIGVFAGAGIPHMAV